MIDYNEILYEDYEGNRNRRNYLREGNGLEIAIKAGVAGVILLAAFGIKSCNDNVADKALQDLGCLDNYQKFNLDDNGSIHKSLGIGDTQSKAMYAAVVSYARQHDISIDKAAKELTGDFKKKLKTEFKDKSSILNFHGRITGVSVLRDSETGERLVRVDSEWQEAHSSSSGGHSHTYYTTEHGTVYIPMSEGNIYGIDQQGNSTVINGVEYVLEEGWRNRRPRYTI